MNPHWLVLSLFLIDLVLLLSSALALPACPGEAFYLKSGEALEVEFKRRPGCDVRFVTVERGVIDRKLFYPSGKTDDRRLTAREGDIPEAWSELPQKAYLKASAETVVRFLAVSPPTAVKEKAPREVCPGMVLTLSPGEEEVIHLGRRPGCTVTWSDYTGTVEEFITYPSGKTQRRVISPNSKEFNYAENPLSLRLKAITPVTLKFFAQKPQPLRTPPPQATQQPQTTRPSQPPWTWPQSTTPITSTAHKLLGQAIGILFFGGFVLLLIRFVNSSSVLILGHWSKLIENLQASPKEFYTSVEEAIARRQVPAITNSRINWKEGGLFTAWREYLRISREKEVVDICASPYGTGFFVSWWHGELLPSAIGPTVVTFLLFMLIHSITSVLFGFTLSLIATPIVALLLFVIVGILINRSGGENWVRYVLAIPVIGWLMDRLFLPPTYYRIDSASMFRAAIEQSVHEIIDQLTQARGLRSLTELERKPMLRDFVQNLR